MSEVPQEPVKIIMGLHPHAGWRSFKTSKTVSVFKAWKTDLIVYDRPHTQCANLTTVFGHKLLFRLGYIGRGSAGLVDRIRYRTKQFEIFLAQDGPTWDDLLPQILHYIALAHSDTSLYELEVRDMSGGEPRWDMEPDEDLEEIEEFSDSFRVN